MSSFKLQNGRNEATRIAGLERRLVSAESAAEAARQQLVEAIEQAETAQIDMGKYAALQDTCKVRALHTMLS